MSSEVKTSEDLPLVSILVMTYNSSDYILKTLDSAKKQTYSNIELIITDDFSTDDTVSKCEKWLKSNSNRFSRSKLVKADRNTGIPKNLNRGFDKLSGVWIKVIAGDDILLDNCVADNIKFVSRHPEVKLLFSKPIYIDEFDKEIRGDGLKKFNDDEPFYRLNAHNQFLHLLSRDHPINPPTFFCNRITMEELGRFDEKHKNEDYPLYLKASSSGIKLYFLNKFTVKYRIHSASFSQVVKTSEAISEWNYNKLNNTIISYLNTDFIFSNPITAADIYNKLLYYKLIKMFGNTKRSKKNLSFIRYFSPLAIKNSFLKIFR